MRARGWHMVLISSQVYLEPLNISRPTPIVVPAEHPLTHTGFLAEKPPTPPANKKLLFLLVFSLFFFFFSISNKKVARPTK